MNKFVPIMFQWGVAGGQNDLALLSCERIDEKNRQGYFPVLCIEAWSLGPLGHGRKPLGLGRPKEFQKSQRSGKAVE